MPWLLIFFLTPIAEMYLLIKVAGHIDAWPTVGLVMLTAVVGVALLKRQGLLTLTRGMGRLQRGEVPATEMAEGILLAVAGALLVTPGFITDTVGFVLLFPPNSCCSVQPHPTIPVPLAPITSSASKSADNICPKSPAI